jgi:site-specific recombinase XerD
MPERVLEAFETAGLDRRRPFADQTSRLLADRVRRHAWRLAQRRVISAVYSAHDYRHYFAVTQYRDGRDLYSLKELLGHSDIHTTERYLRALGILAPADSTPC